MKKVRGKIVGGLLGFVAGGVPGAAFGAVVGHMYDNRVDSGHDPWTRLVDSYSDFQGNVQQTTFTVGVIVLGAKMAKADGRVTRAEIEAFKRVFQITPQQEQRIGNLFNRARQSASGFEPYAFQLAHVFRNNRTVLEEILGGLFIIAAADNAGLSAAEINFLERVAFIFNFNVDDFSRIAARSGVRLQRPEAPRDTAQESYEILGVSASASGDEIKLAYRALIREHHPDRLMAQGMPPEFIATAEEKMKRINVAYDVVCKIKGIK